MRSIFATMRCSRDSHADAGRDFSWTRGRTVHRTRGRHTIRFSSFSQGVTVQGRERNKGLGLASATGLKCVGVRGGGSQRSVEQFPPLDAPCPVLSCLVVSGFMLDRIAFVSRHAELPTLYSHLCSQLETWCQY